MVLFILLHKVVITFDSVLWMNSLSVAIQMNATEQYFYVVLFIMLYKMVISVVLDNHLRIKINEIIQRFDVILISFSSNDFFPSLENDIKMISKRMGKNMVMDVSATTVAFLSKDKNANV